MTDPSTTDNALSSASRLLSKILRHEPDLVGITLDRAGWIDIDTLLAAIHKAAKAPGASKRLRTLPTLTRAILMEVVATNDKQRFAISPCGQRIRAVQGHSVTVELAHPVQEPPAVLYHGTAAANWAAISREGLHPRSRHAVHLSPNAETARTVGARHGRPIVLVVATGRMHAAGFTFSRADNGVWLVDHVPPEFLTRSD